MSRSSMRMRLGVVLMVLITCAAGAAQAGPAYTAPLKLDRAGAAQVQLWDINDSQHIVGSSGNADNSMATAFVYSNGSFTDISPAGAFYSAATGISNAGVVVGLYRSGDVSAPTSRSFVYQNGSFTDFDVAGSVQTDLRHISSDGRYMTGTWVEADGPFRGFVYDRVTQQRTDLTLGDGLGTIAQGVNVHGQVTGSTLGAASRSFIYDVTTAQYQIFTSTDAGTRPRFRDINDAGLITGFDNVSLRAFVGAPGNWTVFDVPDGMDSIFGYGLNNQGDLVGYTLDADGLLHGFTAQPVPEPAAWLLLALGLPVLLFSCRRQPAHAASARSGCRPRTPG